MIADLFRALAAWIEGRIYNWICPPSVWEWWAEGDPFDKYVGMG